MTQRALITGGAGFIGTNLALSMAKEGWQITLLDNLSRKGTNKNLEFLRKNIPSKNLNFIKADVRDKNIYKYLNVDAVIHLAGQTAVTTSLVDPRNDFDVNAYGTFNLLESIRTKNPKAAFIFASTNKVYGSLSRLKKYPEKGLNEDTPLDYHSPYGVSKGTADAYTLDYARIFNLNTVVLRQSCIYGTHQLGIEDQGWVAHMGSRALFGKQINIFGNGKQVRDLLYIEDLTDLYLKSLKNIKKVRGEAFNVGGGKSNSMSVGLYVKYLQKHTSKKLKIKSFPARPGDQPYFVSDNTKAKKLLNWTPVTSVNKGLPLMLDWIAANKKLFDSFNK